MLPTTPHISDTEYHRDTTRISKSGLDLINISPLHYWEKYLNPEHVEKETDALRLGKGIHLWILEPHRADEGIAIQPFFGHPNSNDAKRAKAEFFALNAGKIIVNQDEYIMIKKMGESARNNRIVREIMKTGQAEKTVLFEHPFNNAPCKIRTDFFNPSLGSGVILDIKSTEDASPRGFGYSCKKYRYHVQDQFYKEGIAAETGLNPAMVFAAIEKKPPYACAVYTIPEDARTLAYREICDNLDTYMNARETGIWQGYDERVTEVKFPMWK